jgi:hypothetical protein
MNTLMDPVFAMDETFPPLVEAAWISCVTR